MLGEIALAIGTEVAKKVYEARVEGISRHGTISSALAERGMGVLDRRRAQRQFEQMAESVSESLNALLEIEAARTPENETAAALRAVVESVANANIDISAVLNADLEPSKLEDEVRRGSEAIVRSYALSEGGTYVYDLVLRESCNYIAEIASSIPEISGHAFREILSRETAMRELVNEVLARIPRPDKNRPSSPDADFELRYRRAIARRLETLQLFGVTLSEASRRVSLDVAYISLTANVVSEEAHAAEFSAVSVLDGTPVGDAKVSDRLNIGGREGIFRIDEVHGKFKRMLIKGEAGSGKTTLLQWLAVNSARQSFRGSTEALNGTIPVFIQLRRYVNDELPMPQDFLRRSVPSLSGEMPSGWMNRQLAQGRALVLVDGIDELPEHQRESVALWLDDLIETYDDCRLVITSRPSAVSDNWLNKSDFQLVELQPMSLADIRSFVDHWHEAAAKAVVDEEELRELDSFCEGLKEIVGTTASIRTLAATPLLCAMLCALNRDRRTRLPRDRMELYRIALETLLDRRDVERSVASDIPELSLREKEIVLQDLAFWLVLNSQTDTSVSAVIERVSRKLESMPHVNESADAVYRHLLVRSGLLREPIAERVDFIHRTFQEYLAAKEAVEQDNIPLLIGKGADETWRETLILSCGHASARQRQILLSGLLDRGDREPDERHALHLLAVACLETSSELSPDLAGRIGKSLKDLVPPTSMGEARAVSSAGDLAVPSLCGYKREKVNIVAACVRALSLIGTEASLQAMRGYGGDSRQTVIRELIRAWRSYDSQQYAELVLSKTRFRHGSLDVSEPELVDIVQRLRNVEKIHCEITSTVTDLGFIRGATKVSSLIFVGRRIDTIEPLRELVNLQILVFFPGPELKDLSPIKSLSRLEYLDLSGLIAKDLNFLPKDGILKVCRIGLHPDASLSSIEGLRSQPELYEIHLSGITESLDLSPILDCGSLRTIGIGSSRLADLGWIPSDGVRFLNFRSTEILSDRGLSRCRSIEHVHLNNVTNEDFGKMLTSLTGLNRFTSLNQEFRSTLRLSANVRSIEIRSSDVTDLSFLPSEAVEVVIGGCLSLTDISRVAELKNLQRISIYGCESLEEISPLKKLGDNVRVHYRE